MKMTRPSSSAALPNRLGIVLSTACVLQCIAVPVLVTLTPTVAVLSAVHHSLHPLLVMLAIPVSLFAFLLGHRRHRSIIPLLISIPGLLCLMLGLILPLPHIHEIVITSAGGFLIVAAHLINAKRERHYYAGSFQAQI